MKRFIICLLGVLVSWFAFSEEYGLDHTLCDSRYFIGTGEAAIRTAPSNQAGVLFVAEAGDVFYVDSNEIVVGDDGSQWLKISGVDSGYVPYTVLTREDNPEYVKPLSAEDYVFQTPKWLLILITVVFLLYSFLFLWWRRRHLFTDFAGKVQPNGMKKILFYNREPYLRCLEIVLWIALAFVAAFATIILVGGLVFGMGWAANILARVFVWALIILGFGGAVYLGFNVLSEKEFWVKLLSAIFAVALFYLAINAIDWREAFYEFGENAVDWGREVFQVFNIFQIGLSIVSVYWKYALLVALLPLAVLLICALGFILFNAILVASEKVTMKRYGVEHPCPHCHQPSEPAIYYSKGIPLPRDVELRPGQWGVFSIIHPVTMEKLPTRFSDGKDLLERECPHCGHMISASVGAEKHVAFAGLSGSGKSALMYRLMGRIRDMMIGNEAIARMTDVANTGGDKEFNSLYENTIKGGKEMTTMPRQTQQKRHKSLQILVNNPKHVLPYRLFFNDVAGEMFTASGNRVENAPFFRDVQVIVFQLDPLTMKTSDLDLSPRMKAWFGARGMGVSAASYKVSIDEAVDRLMNMLREAYRRNTRDVHLIVNLAKPDEGYLGNTPRTSRELRSFVEEDLGLGNQIARWDQSFKSVTFYATSALEEAQKSSADVLLSDIFDKLDISFKGVTENALRENRLEYEKKLEERKAESKRMRTGAKAPAIRAALIAILAVLTVLVSFITVDSRKKAQNYKATQETVNKVFTGKEYDEAAQIIDRALKTKKFSGRQKTRLKKQRDDYLREKENRIEALTSTLSVNFAVPADGTSNVETSAKYKALDNLRSIKETLDELELLDPENQDLLSFRAKFDDIIKKYKIKL